MALLFHSTSFLLHTGWKFVLFYRPLTLPYYRNKGLIIITIFLWSCLERQLRNFIWFKIQLSIYYLGASDQFEIFLLPATVFLCAIWDTSEVGPAYFKDYFSLQALWSGQHNAGFVHLILFKSRGVLSYFSNILTCPACQLSREKAEFRNIFFFKK